MSHYLVRYLKNISVKVYRFIDRKVTRVKNLHFSDNENPKN